MVGVGCPGAEGDLTVAAVLKVQLRKCQNLFSSPQQREKKMFLFLQICQKIPNLSKKSKF